MKKIMTVMMGIVLAGTQLAHAAIVDNGTYTTDTTSGLDWLDLTFTTGKSVFDVNALTGIGGVYDEWSFAKSSQLDTFVFNFTGKSSISEVNSSSSPTLLDGLITMLGQTFTGSSSTIYGTKGLVDELAFGSSTYVVKSLERFNAAPIYGTYTQSNSNRVESVGAYLVRPTTFTLANQVSAVPEPETYAMFLAGLGLFGFAIRRKV